MGSPQPTQAGSPLQVLVLAVAQAPRRGWMDPSGDSTRSSISKKMAGVQMRLITGGIRELHWHVGAEWALMLYGSARITAVDQEGRSHVSDITKGDLWIFPGGIPHSIQGLGPDGCEFLLVFDDGNFNEFDTSC